MTLNIFHNVPFGRSQVNMSQREPFINLNNKTIKYILGSRVDNGSVTTLGWVINIFGKLKLNPCVCIYKVKLFNLSNKVNVY